MGIISKVLYAVFFLAGFVLASHWDGGRDIVRTYSPLAEKTITQKMKQVQKNVENQVEGKVKDIVNKGKKALQ